MAYLGDYAEDYATLTFTFSTRKDTGLPTVLTGSPVITIYKASSTSGKTSAESYITLAPDFNSKVGLNHVLVDLSGDAFFATGNDYHVVITTGTVNSISVIGETVATFSIENRFMRGTDSAAPASLFTGITSLAEWLGLLAGKQVGDATAVAEIKTTGAGSGTFNPTTDSTQAIRDHIANGANLTEAGGTGDHLTDLGGMSTGMKAEVNVEADGAFATWAPPTKTEMDTAHGLLVPIAGSGAVETSGSNSSTQVQTNLAEASNGHYDVMTILFTSGDEAGQSRLITGYVGSTAVVSWNAALTGTPADDVTFVILSAGTTADAVWDEILTGSSHNIPTSAGKRLRELEQAFVQASGVIATVTDGHTFTLDAGALATADYYPHSRLTITEGTGAGQSRLITNYTSGRVVTLESDFATNPDTSSLYAIEAADANVAASSTFLAQGFVATYTNTTTITLDTTVATGDYYVGALITFPNGTGSGQSREITAYTSGRVVTMSPALTTALAAGTAYIIMSQDPHIRTTAIDAAAVLVDTNELQADWTDGGRLDLLLDAIKAITDLLTLAAINAEVDTALATTTYAEPGQEAPAATASLEVKIGYLYKFLRNRVTQTATTMSVYNDDAATVDHKSTISDNGTTYDKGEIATGP